MRPVLAIAGRDVRALLRTPSGWVVLAAFAALAGAFYAALLDSYVLRARDTVFDPYGAQTLSLTDHLLAPFFGNLALLVLFLAPAVAMRSFADEVRLHTRELLATAPLTAWQIAVGKWWGGLVFVAVALGATVWMPLSLALWSTPDLGAIAAGYLTLGLLAAAVVAIGTLASASTEQPLVALVVTFAVTLTLWIVAWADADPTSIASQLSLATHVQDGARGAVRLSDVSYFVMVTGWCLVATWQRVALWRSA